MGEFEASADVCEQNGFARQAALLRRAASGGLRVYVLMERINMAEEGPGDDVVGVPKSLHLDRAEAEREALRRETLAYREVNLYAYCDGYIGDITNDLGADDLARRIGDVLGAPYELPDPDTHSGPLFPPDVTDAQIRDLMNLFNFRFFYVSEAVLSA